MTTLDYTMTTKDDNVNANVIHQSQPVEKLLAAHRAEMNALEEANDAEYSCCYCCPTPYWDKLWELEDLAFEENKDWIVPAWEKYLCVFEQVHTGWVYSVEDRSHQHSRCSRNLAHSFSELKKCPENIHCPHEGQVYCRTDDTGIARIDQMMRDHPNIQRMIDMYAMHDL